MISSHLWWSSWRFTIVSAVVGGCAALFLSALDLPYRYASTVRVLITQPNAAGLDPYTAIKTTERIALNLNEIIFTSHFFTNVMQQATGFRPSYFPTDERAKRKAWQRTIFSETSVGSGIMRVTAFHPSRAQARVLVEAVARELALVAPNFFGYNVRVQVIDTPLDSRWIAQPNVLRNGLVGLALGWMLGAIWSIARLYRRS